MRILGLTKPTDRHSRFEPGLDLISLIILLMLLLMLALGFVYLQHHFVNAQRNGVIIPKPATKS